jgi:hypothetical protein
MAGTRRIDAGKGGIWGNFVRSGIGYAPIAKSGPDGDLHFDNAQRPTLSFSLGQVPNARRDRDVRAKRESLASSAALDREKATSNSTDCCTEHDFHL